MIIESRPLIQPTMPFTVLTIGPTQLGAFEVLNLRLEGAPRPQDFDARAKHMIEARPSLVVIIETLPRAPFYRCMKSLEVAEMRALSSKNPAAHAIQRDLSALNSEVCVAYPGKNGRAPGGHGRPLVTIRSKTLTPKEGSSRAPRRLRRRVALEQRPPLPRDRRPRRVPTARPIILVVRRPASIKAVVGF